MPHKRLGQFLLVYCLGLGSLLAVKYLLGLSDYVIPGPGEILGATADVSARYIPDVLNTLGVAVLGHLISVGLAFTVAVIGQIAERLGSFIRIAAYNIQAYPVVAVAPIIFILLGDGLAARLVIAVLICYFPILLSFISIFSEPVPQIEHFYRQIGEISWHLRIKIRAFENLGKLNTVIGGTATLAMVGTIVAEFIAAGAGIGHSIRIALYQSDLAKILVALFYIGICTSLYLAVLEWLGVRFRRHWEEKE